jgi:predicted alpha/beta hydrolase family esterase
MGRPTILVLPGYGDSGPEHWQTLWERRFGYVRVRQDDWERPALGDWVARLDAAVAAASAPVALVAHSLGCALVAHWAEREGARRVAGALLVAPPDVDEICHLMPEVATFAPMPAARLPFPAVVVASTDDPYADAATVRRFATAWGARFVDVGAKGHLNAESNLGEWLEGHRLLDELLEGRVS